MSEHPKCSQCGEDNIGVLHKSYMTGIVNCLECLGVND